MSGESAGQRDSSAVEIKGVPDVVNASANPPFAKRVDLGVCSLDGLLMRRTS